MLLSEFLKNEEISKKSFAQKIGVSRMAVSYYCSGKRKPYYRVMEKIFETTKGKVTPNDFLNLNYSDQNLYKTPKKPLIATLATKNLNELANQ